MIKLVPIEPEYIYITIPAEYICVYHRILAMMADYGVEMLKDCKANCTDRNSNVIECFNMFNSAVAARKLGKTKLAETLIKYIKAKINQIYKDFDNSTDFVFPIDENGQIKAYVSCGERPSFEIDEKDMNLYKHKYGEGFDEHFHLGPEDETSDIEGEGDKAKLVVDFVPRYELYQGEMTACGDLTVTYDGQEIDYQDATINYYFDNIFVRNFNAVRNFSKGTHLFTVVVIYKDITKVVEKTLDYETS